MSVCLGVGGWCFKVLPYLLWFCHLWTETNSLARGKSFGACVSREFLSFSWPVMKNEPPLIGFEPSWNHKIPHSVSGTPLLWAVIFSHSTMYYYLLEETPHTPLTKIRFVCRSSDPSLVPKTNKVNFHSCAL